MKMIMVYATFKDSAEARRIIQWLLKNKLIACANLLPVKSYYRWQGKINHEFEVAAWLKTVPSKWSKLQTEFKKLHSDKVPCLIKLAATPQPGFGKWLTAELK